MDTFLTIAATLFVAFWTIVGPFVVTLAAIWLGLVVAELFASFIPIFGKPLAKLIHGFRNLYVELITWCWKRIARPFLSAFGRGLVRLAEMFFPAFGRGLVRIKDSVAAKLGGSAPPP